MHYCIALLCFCNFFSLWNFCSCFFFYYPFLLFYALLFFCLGFFFYYSSNISFFLFLQVTWFTTELIVTDVDFMPSVAQHVILNDTLYIVLSLLYHPPVPLSGLQSQQQFLCLPLLHVLLFMVVFPVFTLLYKYVVFVLVFDCWNNIIYFVVSDWYSLLSLNLTCADCLNYFANDGQCIGHNSWIFPLSDFQFFILLKEVTIFFFCCFTFSKTLWCIAYVRYHLTDIIEGVCILFFH